jgi:hypothetical protein
VSCEKSVAEAARERSARFADAMKREWMAEELRKMGHRIYSESDYPDLDNGIRRAVRVLMENGVETFESCEGGPGHSYPEPTVRFDGALNAGWHAIGICLAFGLPVLALRRIWPVIRNEPTGPFWEVVFREQVSEALAEKERKP